jgi:hypothetical protein
MFVRNYVQNMLQVHVYGSLALVNYPMLRLQCRRFSAANQSASVAEWRRREAIG